MVGQPTLVGLDVGTTGVKALAISPEGEVLAHAEAEYPLSTPQPGWAEQDPEDWWRASGEALAALGVEILLVHTSTAVFLGIPLVGFLAARFLLSRQSASSDLAPGTEHEQ